MLFAGFQHQQHLGSIASIKGNWKEIHLYGRYHEQSVRHTDDGFIKTAGVLITECSWCNLIQQGISLLSYPDNLILEVRWLCYQTVLEDCQIT